MSDDDNKVILRPSDRELDMIGEAASLRRMTIPQFILLVATRKAKRELKRLERLQYQGGSHAQAKRKAKTQTAAH